MSASNLATKARRQTGFSLVELLVSLVFISILMAGMLRVFSASLSNFVASTESINIQRSARWGLLRMQDDLFQLGYLMPPRVVTELVGSTQVPIRIETSQDTFKYTDSDGNDQTITSPDILEMVMDLPLDTKGTLATALEVDDASIEVTVPYGGGDVKAGDVMFIADSAWEVFKIKSVVQSGTSLTITPEGSGALQDDYGNDISGGSIMSAKVTKKHFMTSPVEFVRPLQVVRYTVLPMSIDPANDKAQVPCLVRQTKAFSDPDFTATSPTPEIIVEGVTGLTLDWSLNGGKNWIRKENGLTTAAWEKIKDATTGSLQTLGSTNPFIQKLTDYDTNGISSTVDPFWFNYVPLVIKFDVETRTRLQRTEYADTPGAVAYRTRRQTLLVSPRNFSLGHPSGN